MTIHDISKSIKRKVVFDLILEEACRQWCCFIDEIPERKDGEGFSQFFYEIFEDKEKEYFEEFGRDIIQANRKQDIQERDIR